LPFFDKKFDNRAILLQKSLSWEIEEFMPHNFAVAPEKFTTFGELLRFLRRKAGLTQRELAVAVGYSDSQMSRLEQNERVPEEAMLAARFVPALYIEDEPLWVTRLLELGATTRAHVSDAEPLLPIAEAKYTPHNLPIQLTSFIGRGKEITEIKRFLCGGGSGRLLTLTGHGGCGKTRLALQSASGLLSDFHDGVWLIELAPLTDPALLPQKVMAVLGLKEESSRSLLSTLTNHLSSKRVLLILDNCEHLIRASAQLIDVILHACPDVHILATSREMLGVAGERALIVPSLSMPDPDQASSVELLSKYEALDLFVERAAIVKPDFTLTPENASAVTQICQRLDGIPLAIELAAARLRMLTVEQVAVRLNDAFHLLTGGNRTALPRNQTLQASIDWSYELLTHLEKIIFRRLAVFSGGWTVEAAEAVCSGEGLGRDEVFDLLAHVLDKSLAIADEQSSTVRYHMLGTVRQYAMSKLAESGEADLVRLRHAMYYLTLAEPDSVVAPWVRTQGYFDRMETEHNNVQAALRWSHSARGRAELELGLAGALGDFCEDRGYWDEARAWLEDSLAHADAEDVGKTELRAQVLMQLGKIRALQGEYEVGQRYLAASLKIYQELGDPQTTALLLIHMGWLARERGDVLTARLQLEQGLVISRQLGQKTRIAYALITLAEVLVMQEDAEGATKLLEEALPIYRELGDPNGVGWALNHLGHVAQIRGQYDSAVRLHEESLTFFRDSWHGSPVGIPWAHQGLGETALAQGNAALAAIHLTDALRLFHEQGDLEGVSFCLAGLAGVAAVNEEPERAAWLWGAAMALRQSIGARSAPAARATHERLQAEARNELSDAVFNAKWAEGQSVSLEQAIAEGTR
jgi:predicted ATPase/transcriptional regulator with XRE-family HTH domain